MNVTVDVINASGQADVPSRKDFHHWTSVALAHVSDRSAPHEVSIRIVNEAESAHLNETYRHKPGPTNVLSFPFSGYHPEDLVLMGDLAICAPVVEREAREQDKESRAHWGHMCVHGLLHLHGYDHESSVEAEEMEGQEIVILKQLGFADPYQSK